jgi:hypothetical protein
MTCSEKPPDGNLAGIGRSRAARFQIFAASVHDHVIAARVNQMGLPER